FGNNGKSERSSAHSDGLRRVSEPFRRLWSRRSLRRRPAAVHAFDLQLHGFGRAAFGHCRAAVRHHRHGRGGVRHAAASAGGAGPAGLRHGDELRRQPPVHRCHAGPVSGLQRGDGHVAVGDLLCLYRPFDRGDVLRHR
ncbi:hypothetical protein OY671_011062, partial [Metschnikowia pulcherrima]